MKPKIIVFLIYLFISTYSINGQERYITLTSPDGYENVRAGEEIIITWTSVNIDSIAIEFYDNEQLLWKPIESAIKTNPKHYKWIIPTISNSEIVIRLRDIKNEKNYSVSKPIKVVRLGKMINRSILSTPQSLNANIVKIMPLGNSITRGFAGSTLSVGYRRSLYQQLENFGYSIDFVGTKMDGYLTDFDLDHEGHGGWHASHPTNVKISLVDSVSKWLQINSPNIVLLHIGTNDISEMESNNENVSDLVGELNAILDSIEVYEISSGNHITIFLAQITNRIDDSITSLDENATTTQYNSEINNLAITRNALGDDIIVVDMESALTYPDDLFDGIHPNDNGYNKMANTWFSSLNSFLGFPPEVIKHPRSKGIFEGEVAEFKVVVNGARPFSYQWKKNGLEIVNATDSVYTTPPGAISDNGSIYTCTVSNAIGQVKSNQAFLYITSSQDTVSGGQIVQYNFDEGTGDIIYDNSTFGQPLNLHIDNLSNIQWLNDGLQVISPTQITSLQPALKISEKCKYSNEISIEVWVKPSNLSQNGPSRIITYSPDKSNRNFTFGQEYDSYQVGFRTTNTSLAGAPINSGFETATTGLTHIVFSRNSEGNAKIYINGELKIQDSINFTGTLANWDSTYNLALANEFDVARPFLGTYKYISLFDRELSQAEIQHNYVVTQPYIASPSELEVLFDINNNAHLSWTDNSNDENGFILERSASDSLSFEIIDSVSVDENTYVDSSLIDGKRYFYRVYSYNEETISIPSNISSLLIPLTKPSNLSVSINNYNFPELNWDDNSSGELGFIIEVRAAHTDSSFRALDSVSANINTFIDTIPKFYSPYIYRIIAYSLDTISNYSNEYEISVVGLESQLLSIPKEFSLSQNYPNPFNPQTTIKFDLPENSKVDLKVYNSIGQHITTLVKGFQLAGSHEVKFNAQNYSSGIYFYRIEVKTISGLGFKDIKKIILLK